MVNLTNLKIVLLILRLQTDYTKYCCFLCEWNSRAHEENYMNQIFSFRSRHLRKTNTHEIHIKLVLISRFVKTFPKDGTEFILLKNKFRRHSNAKRKS